MKARLIVNAGDALISYIDISRFMGSGLLGIARNEHNRIVQCKSRHHGCGRPAIRNA